MTKFDNPFKSKIMKHTEALEYFRTKMRNAKKQIIAANTIIAYDDEGYPMTETNDIAVDISCAHDAIIQEISLMALREQIEFDEDCEDIDQLIFDIDSISGEYDLC